MKQTVNVSSKAEIKAAVISTQFGGYNYFEGDIRKNNRYARIIFFHIGKKLNIQITYWEDGKDVAVDFASHCSTGNVVVNKVSKFLNVK